MISKTHTVLDYVFIAPSILLILTFICGIVPSLWCNLDKLIFAYLSLAMFIISIGFHIYSLILWKRYWGLAPLAYAIGQPTMHFAVMTFSMIVSATMTCERVAETNKPDRLEFSQLSADHRVLENLNLFLDEIGTQKTNNQE